jgi:2-dehydropantoate 2-reductase
LEPPPRIVFLGAGSVGCFIGGAWAAAGLPVSFIGRARTQAEVESHGITVTDGDSVRLHLPADTVAFSTEPEALGEAEVVALCVKSFDTEAAAGEIARFARPGATVISFQNGVGNVETLRAALPGFQIVGGMVPYNVAAMGGGRWHKGVAGELIAGRSAVTERIAAAVAGRPGAMRLADDMAEVSWGKLLINLNNAVNALSGRTLLEQLSQRDYRRVFAASIAEALEVLEAAGIAPAKLGPLAPALLPKALSAPDLIFNNSFLKLQRIDANARSSMADDLAAGRRTEIDYLNGEVVRLARGLGRPAPVNEAILALVKRAEAGDPKRWTARALRAEVLA